METKPIVSPWWVLASCAPAWSAYLAWKNMVEEIFFKPLAPRRHRDLE